MISDTEFQFIKPKRNFYTQNEVQPSVGDSGAPVFAYKHPKKRNKKKDKDQEQEVSNAFLVGVTSVSQYLAEQSQRPKSEKREWMSEQVMQDLVCHPNIYFPFSRWCRGFGQFLDGYPTELKTSLMFA